MGYRIGIDLGGTKTEIAVLGPDGLIGLRRRAETPLEYGEVLAMLARLIGEMEAEIGATASIGIGIPGTMSPRTGLMRTPNTPGLHGRPFDVDIAAYLGREIRIANDANCFALSEATDGAGAGAKVVFGVILGTGCGGGLVVNGQVVVGRNGIAGEWGHNPLPWPAADDLPLRACPCGRTGCIERYVAGPALAFEADGEGARDASQLLARAAAGDGRAIRAFAAHAERLARALATITNVFDPDVVVLGGGLSNLPHLYTDVPELMKPYVFSDSFTTKIVPNAHGDSSGVRGAAWLWPA
jgi:fructokinase